MNLSLEEQLILNYFKIVGVSDAKETENMFKEIMAFSKNKEDSANNLGNVLTSINRVIKNYDLEITEAVDEVSMRKIHCLISTNTSSVAQKASFYTKNTCELLSKIIQECVLSESGYVSEVFCLSLNIGGKCNNPSIESYLDRLVKDKWLVSKDGNITLGMRCKLELEVSIKKQYPNHVKHCSLCKMFLVQGSTCPKCGSHIHFNCITKYYKVNNLPSSLRMCPICKEETDAMESDDVEMRSLENEVDEPPAKRSKNDMYE